MRLRAITILAALAAGVAAMPVAAKAPPAPPPGARYVAMGSSFAAGLGIAPTANAPTDAARCARSADNYAQQIARRRGLTLVDVSCSGAMTTHILGPWGNLPAQIDAVDPQTRLVTVTIGGNDIGYVGQMFAHACAGRPPLPTNATVPPCPAVAPPDEAKYAQLAANLRRIVEAVKTRAPGARLVFLQYPALLPHRGSCAAAGLSAADAAVMRGVAVRLAAITARAARQGGAELVATDHLSRGHEACAGAAAWVNGFGTAPKPGDGVFYHPNLAGMTAQATALDRLIWRGR
jgi:lysophospholipase L1-like esterase